MALTPPPTPGGPFEKGPFAILGLNGPPTRDDVKRLDQAVGQKPAQHNALQALTDQSIAQDLLRELYKLTKGPDAVSPEAAGMMFDVWLSDLSDTWPEFRGMWPRGPLSFNTGSPDWDANGKILLRLTSSARRALDDVQVGGSDELNGRQAQLLLKALVEVESAHDDRLKGRVDLAHRDATAMAWLLGVAGFQITKPEADSGFAFRSFKPEQLPNPPNIDLTDLNAPHSRQILAAQYWAVQGAGRLLHDSEKTPLKFVMEIVEEIVTHAKISCKRSRRGSDLPELAAKMQIAELLGCVIGTPEFAQKLSVPIVGIDVKIAGPEFANAVTPRAPIQGGSISGAGWGD